MTEPRSGTLTTDGTEQDLYVNSMALGAFRATGAFVNLDNMASGDSIAIRVYYRIVFGGALVLADYQEFAGADGGLSDSIKQIEIGLSRTRYGVQITLRRTAGGDRAYLWEVFEEN